MTLGKNFSTNTTPAEGDFFPSWLAAEGSGSERKTTLAQLRTALFGTSTYAVGDLLQASSTTALAKLAAVATGNVLLSGGVTTASAWGKVTLTGHVSGVLAETNGGTNQSSYTTGDLLQATGSNTLGKLAAVATGNVLISGGVGTASSWGKVALASAVSGTLPETSGGTGQATLTQGDILYCSAGNTMSKLAKNTTATRVLTNTGTSNNPAWAQVDLTTGVTGTLPVVNGGDKHTIAYLDVDGSTTASATPSDVSGLAVTLVSGKRYSVHIQLHFRTNLGSGGLVFGLTYPAQTFAAFEVVIPTNADGVGRSWGGRITGATGGSVTATSAPSATTTYVTICTGAIKPSAGGLLQVQIGSEDGASVLTPKAGSHIIVTELG